MDRSIWPVRSRYKGVIVDLKVLHRTLDKVTTLVMARNRLLRLGRTYLRGKEVAVCLTRVRIDVEIEGLSAHTRRRV